MRKKRWLCYIVFCLTTLVTLQARPLDLFINLKGDFLIQFWVCDYVLTLTPHGDIVRMLPVRDARYNGNEFPQTLIPKQFDKGRYTRLNGCEIKYDFFTNRISNFGDLAIKYSLSSKKIEQIGSVGIEYNFASGNIERIGNVPIEYDFFSKKISRIGELRIEYDSRSKKIKGISSPDYAIEFLDQWGKPIDSGFRRGNSTRDLDHYANCPCDRIPDDILEYSAGDIRFFLWIE
ncbi:MAG: hypothetical protein ACRCSQ_06405 [Bacteroidales bacterium]